MLPQYSLPAHPSPSGGIQRRQVHDPSVATHNGAAVVAATFVDRDDDGTKGNNSALQPSGRKMALVYSKSLGKICLGLLMTVCIIATAAYIARIGVAVAVLKNDLHQQAVAMQELGSRMHVVVREGTQDLRNQVALQHHQQLTLEKLQKAAQNASSALLESMQGDTNSRLKEVEGAAHRFLGVEMELKRDIAAIKSTLDERLGIEKQLKDELAATKSASANHTGIEQQLKDEVAVIKRVIVKRAGIEKQELQKIREDLTSLQEVVNEIITTLEDSLPEDQPSNVRHGSPDSGQQPPDDAQPQLQGQTGSTGELKLEFTEVTQPQGIEESTKEVVHKASETQTEQGTGQQSTQQEAGQQSTQQEAGQQSTQQEAGQQSTQQEAGQQSTQQKAEGQEDNTEDPPQDEDAAAPDMLR